VLLVVQVHDPMEEYGDPRVGAINLLQVGLSI